MYGAILIFIKEMLLWQFVITAAKKFHMTEAEDEFMTEHGMFISDSELFNNKTLCFECADEAMERRDYYERCEQCGKLFYVCDDDYRFEDECGEFGLVNTGINDISDLILCADCALEVARERYARYQEEHPEYFSNEDNGIDVYEAAQIWASSGKDEDNMFGYSREELENAL